VRAGLAGDRWEEEWAARALSRRAGGMSRTKGRMHAQADGTQRHTIGVTGGRGVSIERDGSTATMTSRRIGDRPCIGGGIGSELGGKRIEGMSGLTVQGAKRRDIAFMEGLGVLSQHTIAVIRRGGRSHTRTVAPETFLLLFCGTIGQCCGGAARDATSAIRITGQAPGVVRALRDGGTLVVFVHPGGEMRDIKGHDVT